MGNNKFGFLSLYETETPDSYIGSLLITDEFGIPVEFKCTHAVKPTAIQKALYGDKLQPYIAIELCGTPLLKSISNQPEIIIVNLPYLLSIRNTIEKPTILIKRAGDTINFESDDTKDKEGSKERMETESGSFQPIVIQSHPDFSDDLNNIREELNSTFNKFDLVEPFERMKKSVEILGKSDSKFK